VLKELVPGIWLEASYESGNVGVIESERGVLLVDPPMRQADAQALQVNLRALGLTTIYGIVNTDYHPDHFLGNAFFMPTRILGHELAAKSIAKYETTPDQVGNPYPTEDAVEDVAQVEVCSPEITVSDRLTLYLGERQIEVLYLEGHTAASLGVYLPRERILFAADNKTHYDHPVMYQANSASWVETLNRMLAMDIEIVVPGSGEPCGKEAIEPLMRYIIEMRQKVETLFLSGASRRECVDKVGMLDYFDFPEDQATIIKRRRRGNVERVYAEIRGAHRRH